MKSTLVLLVAFASVCFAQQKPPDQKPADKPANNEAPADTGLVPGVNTAGITVESGGEATRVTGEKSFIQQEYRDVPKGAVVRRLDLLWLHEGNPLRFRFRSLDLIQRDMTFQANLEDVGRFNIQVDYLGLSRFWGGGGQSVLTEVQRGVFQTSGALRTALETATPGTLGPLARDAINSAPQVDVRSDRQRVTLTQTYNLTKRWTGQLDLLREHRGGHRLSSYGTFIRHPTPQGDVFEVPGIELPEPTDFSITEFGMELTYKRKSFLAGFQYRGSLFVNNTGSLLYENPFEITPQQATGARTSPTPATGGQTGGGGNRGRFDLNQIALAPDNQSHTLTAFAMWLLPHRSKVSGLVSWTRLTQDQAFLPYTVNTAITVTAPTDPTLGVPPQPTLPITDAAALPKRSLNGLVYTLTQDYVATTRPIPQLQLTARYNDYDYDNNTPGILFPGYASVGNSFWANFRTGTPNRPDVLIQSKAQNYNLQKALFEAAVRPTKQWTIKGGYQYRRWNRFNREANLATENGGSASISYAPNNSTFAQVGINYSHLVPSPYADPFGLEVSSLRMFDEARNVHKGSNALFSVTVSPRVTLSGSWLYSGTAYERNLSLVGLRELATNSASADASFNLTDNFGFYLGYGYDRSGYFYDALTSQGLPPLLLYTRDTVDHLHSAHVGFSGSFSKGKGNYEATCELGYAETRITTTNLVPVPPSQALNSAAFPFPFVKNEFNSLRLNASYEILNRVRLGGYYMFEPYRLSDFSYDTLTAYGADSVASDQNDASRYLFLNVGPSSYNGHVGALYLKFSF